MTLTEAIRILRDDPSDSNAISRLYEHLDQVAGSIGCRDDADALRQKLLLEILYMAQQGRLPRLRSPETWLRKRARWRHMDLHRKKTRSTSLEAAKPATRPQELQPTEDCLDLINLVMERAIQLREPRFREEFGKVLQQMLQTVLEGRPLVELVAEAEGTPNANQSDLTKALNRTYKAHSRARRALLDAVDDLERRGPGPAVPGLKQGGGLSKDDAEEARRCLGRFLRVRKLARATSTPVEQR